MMSVQINFILFDCATCNPVDYLLHLLYHCLLPALGHTYKIFAYKWNNLPLPHQHKGPLTIALTIDSTGFPLLFSANTPDSIIG